MINEDQPGDGLTQEKMKSMIAAEDRWKAKRLKLEEVVIPEGEKLYFAKVQKEEDQLIRTINDGLDEVYRKARREMDAQLKLPIDQAKKLMNLVMKAHGFNGKNYRMDKTNLAWIMNQMVLWALADPACEWDIKKGIYLEGNIGRGKTQAMKFLAGFTRAIDYRHSEMVHVKKIIIDVSDAKHLGPLKKYLVGKWIFNDIGYEEDDKLMGNKIDLVDRVFSLRADDNLLTHATGNVPRSEIKATYGPRIDSRWDQLFNSVKVTGPWDFRKPEWKEGFIH